MLIGYFNFGWVVVVRVRRLVVVVVALSFLSDLVEVSVVRLRFEDLVFGFDTSTLLVGSSDCFSSSLLLLARCPSRWATSPYIIANNTMDFNMVNTILNNKLQWGIPKTQSYILKTYQCSTCYPTL